MKDDQLGTNAGASQVPYQRKEHAWFFFLYHRAVSEREERPKASSVRKQRLSDSLTREGSQRPLAQRACCPEPVALRNRTERRVSQKRQAATCRSAAEPGAPGLKKKDPA